MSNNAAGFLAISTRFDDALILVTRSSSLWKDIPQGGILLREDRVKTCFPTRASARVAINRTKQYFAARPKIGGVEREQEDYYIARLQRP